MNQQYAPLLAQLQQCNGDTPDGSQLLASNCVLVNHFNDDNYDGKYHIDTAQFPNGYNGAPVFLTPPNDPTPNFIFKYSDSMWVVQPLPPSSEWLANDYCDCVEGSPCNLPVDIMCTGWRGITVEHCGNCPIRAINRICPNNGGWDGLRYNVACDSECAQIITDSWETCETRHDGVGPNGQTNPDPNVPGSGSIDALKPVLREVAQSCHGLVEQRECTELQNDQQVAFNEACCGSDACSETGLPSTCSPDCARVFMPFFEQCGGITYGDNDYTMNLLSNFNDECRLVTGDLSGNQGARVSCGNPTNSVCEDPYCAQPDEANAVRCCSDDELPGYQQQNGCSVWAESDMDGIDGQSGPGCVLAATMGGAAAVCSGDGARLCTESELEGSCTSGTGCGADAAMIWSSTSCFLGGGGH